MTETKKIVPETPEWRKNLDLDEFKKEIDALGNELRDKIGPEDEAHLHMLLGWNRVIFLVGLLTCWYCINPLSVFCLSLATFVRWTMVGHHVCHGGYDRLKQKKWNRKRFALGLWRRVNDWLDWMLPEAWNCEHNQLHHYQLNEPEGDPDFVQHNLGDIRDSDMPMFARYVSVIFFMFTWKWSYYAPNTLKTLQDAKDKQAGKPVVPTQGYTLLAVLHHNLGYQVFVQALAPFFIYTFLVLPSPFYFLLGYDAFINAVINLVLAELLTNFHSFVCIVTNHAGADLYMFPKPCKPRSGEYYLRQILGSANYATGGNVNDLMHGWLNYQVEHHMWPDLSMLRYQQVQPRVKAICEKYHIPYTQESVWIRLKKTIDIMVGNTSHKIAGW